MRSVPWLRLTSAALVGVVAACSTTPGPEKAKPEDAGLDVERFEGSAAPTRCGTTDCPALDDDVAAQGVTRCCTAGGLCGAETPVTSGCLLADQPGRLDPSCPDVAVASGALRGCCTPAGQCGARHDAVGLGCVPAQALGREPKACEPDAGPACTSLLELACDGPEDCGTGRCCGQLRAGRFERLACFASCTTAAGVSGGLWFEICHPGSPCDEPGHRCLATPELPEGLFRCYVDGDEPPDASAAAEPGVGCGSERCAEGRACCLRSPSPPLCVAPGACACAPVEDAGADAPSDARDDAPSDASDDASSDASDGAFADATSDSPSESSADAARE